MSDPWNRALGPLTLPGDSREAHRARPLSDTLLKAPGRRASIPGPTCCFPADDPAGLGLLRVSQGCASAHIADGETESPPLADPPRVRIVWWARARPWSQGAGLRSELCQQAGCSPRGRISGVPCLSFPPASLREVTSHRKKVLRDFITLSS